MILADKKPRLGRSLGTLLGDEASTEKWRTLPAAEATILPVSWLEISGFAPSIPADPGMAEVDSMFASMKIHGVLKPLKVRPVAPRRYQIIDGHRRWIAAQSLGLSELPVHIVAAAEGEALLWRLVEQAHGAKFGAVTIARVLSGLRQHFGWERSALSSVLEWDEPLIDRLCSLTELPEELLQRLQAMPLTVDQIRSMDSIPDAQGWEYFLISASGAAHSLPEVPDDKAHEMHSGFSADGLEERLTRVLESSVRVHLYTESGRDRLVIDCPNPKVMERLLLRLERE